MMASESQPTARPPRSVISLLAAACLTGLVWCWILPWLSVHPSISRHLQFLDERGIDPSAMFYTELEMMNPILERLEER